MILNISIFLVLSLAIIARAVADGTRSLEIESNIAFIKKKLSLRWHRVSVAADVFLLSGMYMFSTIWACIPDTKLTDNIIDLVINLLIYIALRYVFINYAYNLAAKKKFFYLSKDGLLDGLYLKYIQRFIPEEFVFLFKVFILIVVIKIVVFY